MKKELFEIPTIEVALLDEMDVIETGNCGEGDCCGDGHSGD